MKRMNQMICKCSCSLVDRKHICKELLNLIYTFIDFVLVSVQNWQIDNQSRLCIFNWGIKHLSFQLCIWKPIYFEAIFQIKYIVLF